MKPEKEVLWMVNLLNSKYVKRSFGVSYGGYKSDFEKVAGASENNKYFRAWLNLLIEEKILEPYKDKKTNTFGNDIQTYVINSNKLLAKLRQNWVYKTIGKFAINNDTVFGI